MWIGDTGASHHITNSETGMYNKSISSEDETVTVGKGDNLRVKNFGNIDCILMDKGKKKMLTLKMWVISPIFVQTYLRSTNTYLSGRS